MGLRDSDDRNIATAQLAHIIYPVRGEQQALLTVHNCLAARNCNKALTYFLPSLLRVVLAENFGIKFPSPLIATALQRVKGHIIQSKRLTGSLWWRKHVSAAGCGIVWIAALGLVIVHLKPPNCGRMPHWHCGCRSLPSQRRTPWLFAGQVDMPLRYQVGRNGRYIRARADLKASRISVTIVAGTSTGAKCPPWSWVRCHMKLNIVSMPPPSPAVPS